MRRQAGGICREAGAIFLELYYFGGGGGGYIDVWAPTVMVKMHENGTGHPLSNDESEQDGFGILPPFLPTCWEGPFEAKLGARRLSRNFRSRNREVFNLSHPASKQTLAKQMVLSFWQNNTKQSGLCYNINSLSLDESNIQGTKGHVFQQTS